MPKHSKKVLPNHGLIPTHVKSPISYSSILNKNRIQEASLQYRHDVIQASKRQNYINEYDRLKGMLSNNISKGHHDHHRLQHRQQQLTKLFTQSFTDQNEHHDINKKV